jgi:hypothetical protein
MCIERKLAPSIRQALHFSGTSCETVAFPLPTPRGRHGGRPIETRLVQHTSLDRIARATLVVNDDTPIGIKDQIVLHARKREITAELAAVVDRRRARRLQPR